ncbi:MAG: hypothetical protein V1921_06495 [Candidatus Altiarchaeota archaeon]
MTGTKVVKLKLDGGGAERLPHLKEGKIKQALELFDSVEYLKGSVNYQTNFDYEGYYRKVLEGAEMINASESEVQGILVALEAKRSEIDWFDSHVGTFITAMMQGSKTQEFTLKPKYSLHSIGDYLQGDKKITVFGDMGTIGRKITGGELIIKGNVFDFSGERMTGGKLIIDGFAGGDLGKEMGGGLIEAAEVRGRLLGCYMWGGTIRIKGDAGDEIGANMSKGEIYVGGNAGDKLGDEMRGGKIVVEGEAGHKVGDWATGGQIIVGKKIKSLGAVYSQCEVIVAGEKVAPK